MSVYCKRQAPFENGTVNFRQTELTRKKSAPPVEPDGTQRKNEVSDSLEQCPAIGQPPALCDKFRTSV